MRGLLNGQVTGYSEETLIKFESKIEEARGKSVEEVVQKLKGPLGALGEVGRRNPRTGEASRKRSPREEEVFRKAQQLILSAPGHAKVFTDYIREVEAHFADPNQRGNGKYSRREFSWTFENLWYLPSVEVVKEVADFLDEIQSVEEQNRYFNDNLGRQAAFALLHLLEDPPTMNVYDQKAWMQWRREVEKGERTFTLYESKVPCNFQGPATGGKLSFRPSRESHSSQAITIDSNGSSDSEELSKKEKSGKLSWIYGILGIIITLAILRLMIPRKG